MATHNSYIAYKRNTRHLLYWMVHASNSVVKALPADPDDESDSSTPVALNTSGQTTVAGLVAMAELIGKHIKPIPPAIFKLLRSVIVARSAHHAEFQQFAAAKPDADMEKSNASHKFFIDALARAFKALGGDAWVSSQKAATDLDASEIEQVIFSNKFSALKLGADDGDQSSGESSDDEPGPSAAPQRRASRKPGKGKKGKKGKKPKTKKKQKPSTTARTADLDEVPLESYRIIEDEDGIVTDYLMAVYSIAKEWSDLRNYLQGVWHDVAYKGLNSAVAGTLSNLAIGMVKKTESDIFVDFPGHDSYETLMQTITRGDAERAQSMFTVALLVRAPDASSAQKVEETNIDIKEHVLVNAYRDLVDFVTDFQKNRSGKPTKAMLAEIANWDPDLDLRRATREQRLKWRRSYTINWLYDLVNVFSSVVIQRIRQKGERHVLENVDWSSRGPWCVHRLVFGINDFAAVVTTLAMQRPGTDVRARIMPHHVFQLQLIVDAFTVSRGWKFNVLRGHVLEAPTRGFRPRRDVDLFLDRDNKRNTGYLRSVDILKQLLKRDGVLHGDPARHERFYEVFKELQLDFIDWLGESKYMHGLNTIPPSRFSNSNANGLWEYSPFLCGVGLLEGLELTYRAAMFLWEGIPHPSTLVHLHNMLVEKGYITAPVGLYASLQDIFAEGFFVGGKAPTSDFDKALADRMMNAKRLPPASRQLAPEAQTDLHAILDVRVNRNFRKKSNLLLYREAGWNLDRIPDSELEPLSVLGCVRVSQTKQVVDPATGRKRLADTELVRRLRSLGQSDDELVAMADLLLKAKRSQDDELAAARSSFAADDEVDGYKFFSDAELAKAGKGDNRRTKLTGRELLEFVRVDIHNDVCGDSPISSLNYLSVTMAFLAQFMRFEEELGRVRNPLYVRAYETDQWARAKRMALVTLAMKDQEEECLRVMAEQFQRPRAGFMNFIYWDDLVSASERLEEVAASRRPEDPADNAACSVM
ncbi:hypothetical protein CTA1_11360 [Colletotrichum tanaceti]|uniref:DUF6604 domain-containing protein n=1 Tax=Colletotrichum tanaceti TaxID=1306861 RepID=A0A4U6XKP9_9PEZI|nr:hypothetical protein CTA1_11360 [Colletotrichum tanaceti]